MSAAIKISSPATQEFWEIPVLFEDDHLLALDKPPRLLTSPDAREPQRPSLMERLHAGIAAGKPWASGRGLNYLANVHRLDSDASGVLLLAKSKPVFIALANLFGAEKVTRTCVALVQGAPAEDRFDCTARLAAHPTPAGWVRVDERRGKRARTTFELLERFSGYTLLRCRMLTDRPHQVRAHLRHARLPVVGDALYGGAPLLLSRLKPNYHLKPDHTERPLIATAALHAEGLALVHPVTGAPLTLTAPWPKDLTVAVKYLRRYAAA